MKIYNIKNKNFVLPITEKKDIVCCLGLFDGVHQGHMHLINHVIDIAHETSLQPAVFTLSQSVPQYYAGKHDFIYEQWQKQLIFKNAGFAYYFNYVVSPDSLGISPQTFMSILRNNLNITQIVVGEDFRFGHKAQGNVTDLINFFGQNHVHVIAIDQTAKKIKYSSRNIRSLLARHDLLNANQLLVQKIMHKGEVIIGRQIGRTIGYHTANQKIINKFIMPLGIYITETKVGDKWYPSVSCYWQPDQEVLLETHILNFKQNIYHEIILVKFIKFLRVVETVKSLLELKMLLQEDVKATKLFFNL